MNEEREPGNAAEPVDETAPSTDDVREAIARAKEGAHIRTDEAPSATDATQGVQGVEPAVGESAVAADASAATVQPDPADEPVDAVAAAPAGTTGLTREQHADVSTESIRIPEESQMPSANDDAPSQVDTLIVERAEEAPAKQQISIDPDHPMAALYIQQPMPPTPRGNRLAGTMIALLATVGFAVVYAGLLAIWLARSYSPSMFLEHGLLPLITSLGFILPVVAFFLALELIVLIVGRAGWWAYVLGGFLVALGVWIAAAIGFALAPDFESPFNINSISGMALTIPALLSAVAARETTVWFGAWIGRRGRRMKALNAAEQAEYEAKLAEVQAKIS